MGKMQSVVFLLVLGHVSFSYSKSEKMELLKLEH